MDSRNAELNQMDLPEGTLDYQGIYYKGGEKITISSESKTGLFDMAKADVPDANENALIYISKYNPETEKYITEGRYRLLSGEDVTKVKLEIAYMAKEQFDTVREYIKGLGAKFDTANNSWYVERSNENKDAIIAYLKAQAEIAKPVYENTHEEAYVALSYTKGSTKPVDVRYGNTVDGILTVLQGFNKARVEAEKFTITYVKQLNQETNQYDILVGRFNPETGKDITRIYLELPHAGKTEFAKITEYLKQNGANFDGTEKHWYITAENDMNKFLSYLSINDKEEKIPEEMPEKEQDNIAESKDEFYKIGEEVTVYLPITREFPADEYSEPEADAAVYVVGVEKLSGIVSDIEFGNTEEQYIQISTDAGIQNFWSDKTYTLLQAEIIERAVEANLLPVQIDLVADREFAPEQAEQILFGFRDGLSTDAVMKYANPDFSAAQMDFYRIALGENLTMKEVQPLIADLDISTKDNFEKANNMLMQMVHEKKEGQKGEHQMDAGKNSLLGKLHKKQEEVAKAESENDTKDRTKELPGNVIS